MLLKEHKRVPGSPLFRNRNRHYISSASVGSSFSKFVREFDICDPTLHGKVSFFSLKKTFAARCLEANVQSKVVQKQLSISNNQTMRLSYPETTISARNEAAESTNDYLRSVGIG